MHTFGNNDEEQLQEQHGEQIIEVRDDYTEEPRERALSQEENRNDQSYLIETKSQMSHFGGAKGYALSQYICHPDASVFNDGGDITESEHEDEEVPTR
jgi:hypothetical protein